MENPFCIGGLALFCFGDLALLAYSFIEGWMGWYKMYDRFFHVFWACVAAMALGVLLLIAGAIAGRSTRRF